LKIVQTKLCDAMFIVVILQTGLTHNRFNRGLQYSKGRCTGQGQSKRYDRQVPFQKHDMFEDLNPAIRWSGFRTPTSQHRTHAQTHIHMYKHHALTHTLCKLAHNHAQTHIDKHHTHSHTPCASLHTFFRRSMMRRQPFAWTSTMSPVFYQKSKRLLYGVTRTIWAHELPTRAHIECLNAYCDLSRYSKFATSNLYAVCEMG
jgi:hypothetical protein